MNRSCETCEWARDEVGEPDQLACREGPDPVVVRPEHWCGRFRIAERLIPSLSRLGAEEAVRLMRRPAP